MQIHHIGRDVRGERYRELVGVLLSISASFSLVLRDDLSFDSNGNAIVHALAPFELRRARRRAWPGTRTMTRELPLVVWYRADATALETLCVPGSLFSWREPRHPEDLAFYGADDEPLFASTAHESEAWVLAPVAVRAIARLVTLEKWDVPDESLPILRGEP